MNITVHIAKGNEQHAFNSALGISFLNIAVNNAPYRTGNLRNQIKLTANNKHQKTLIYNEFNAHYLHFLEEGIGRNKMHKGFISVDTVGGVFKETYQFLLTGEVEFTSAPKLALRTDRARNYERVLLKEAGISLDKRLTANDRAKLSNFYLENKVKRVANGSEKIRGIGAEIVGVSLDNKISYRKNKSGIR